MRMDNLGGRTRFSGIARGALAAALMLVGTGAGAQDTSTPRIVLPAPDAERGRFLFASKGCVVCHSVNGVGGSAGPALDAPPDGAPIEPLAFAARMWRGAVAMTVLQSTEFGYQIDITGDEIADLAAFAASPAVQATFSERDIPEVMKGWTLDEGWESLVGESPGDDASEEEAR